MGYCCGKKINFGLVQYPITANPHQNRACVFALLGKILQFKPHYVVLPEMWLGAPTRANQRDKWAKEYKNGLEEITAWCKRTKTGVIFSQLEKKGAKYFNTATFIERDGRIKGRFRKIHLFSLAGEAKIYSAGSRVVSFESLFGRVGCIVCYDIRFPELVRMLAGQGIKVLVVCAQWPADRAKHWLSLLQARAIENQFFVVAVNRLGRKGKMTYKGDSVVFDPWGNKLLHLSGRRKTGVAEVDISRVEKIRNKYPFFRERKLI